MTKRANKYKLTLEQVSLTNEETILAEPLSLEFENHDEVFTIIEKIKEKKLFEDENQSTEFAIGLKMFSEVMLKNRKHPLFEDFFPAFGEFMKKLKSQ
ncbi:MULTISPECIES: DUF3861 domain-containing protein [unclassified Flavobacterium]|uniref:DUF3861 domain-containing protein n=1 Tax=unclassified Flavobacterium TaxID=196869 RepID=UPI00057D077C|nr:MULTISPECIES: DUF3861 domain-containing protein [unclassified Flavobacterium]KIC00347.1 hypothetical protein OA93_01735 [Flavobacterium sp. KMS]MEA9411651.1 DUF3861 domain-containing protein [Flavobacterium sp. PL02]